MKKLLLIFLLAVRVMGAVGPFNDTGLTIGLFKQPPGTASKNTGTLVVVRGPAAPDTVITATMELMPDTCGWRADLESFKFTPTTSNIIITRNIGDYTNRQMTIATRLKMEPFTAQKNIWGKVLTGTVKIVVHYHNVDTIQMRVCNGSSASTMDFVRPSGHAESNTWFNLVAVIDLTQAVATDRIRVYIDGIQCARGNTGTAEIPSTMPVLGTTTLRVGGWGTGDPNVGINGEMKYMLTYNRAFTQSDAVALHNLGPNLGGLELNNDGSLYDTLVRVDAIGVSSGVLFTGYYGRAIDTVTIDGVSQTIISQNGSSLVCRHATPLKSSKAKRTVVLSYGARTYTFPMTFTSKVSGNNINMLLKRK